MLNFKVIEAPATTLVAGKATDIPGYKALIREDTGLPLAVVGNNYKVIQNDELFTQITERVQEALPNANYQVKDKVARSGRICIREFIFNDITTDSTEASKSDMHFRVIMQNSFGWTGIKIFAGAIDFFCTNGIVVGSYTQKFFKHSKNMMVSHLDQPLHQGIELFKDRGGVWKDWQQREIGGDQATNLLKEVGIGPRQSEKLMKRFEFEAQQRGQTLWALYSAMTYFASHNSSEFPLRDTRSDHGAETLLNRELLVQRWVAAPAFQALAA